MCKVFVEKRAAEPAYPIREAFRFGWVVKRNSEMRKLSAKSRPSRLSARGRNRPPYSVTLRSNAAEVSSLRNVLPRVSAFAAQCAGVITLRPLPRLAILSAVRCQCSDRVWRPELKKTTPHCGEGDLSCLSSALWRLCAGGLRACRVFYVFTGSPTRTRLPPHCLATMLGSFLVIKIEIHLCAT
jgi:hypothetical protein